MSRARAIGALTGLNLVGAVLGLGVSVLTANLFGTSREVEVFFAAITLQQVMTRFVQGGQISEAFLPVYHRLRSQSGIGAARTAYAITLNWATLFAVAVSVVVWVLAPWFLRLLVPGFSDADRALGVTMFRVIGLLMPLQVVGALQLCLSNAEKWFGRPEALGLVAQAVSLVLIPALAWRWGVWSLVIAMCASQLLLNAGYIWMLRRLGYRHEWCLRAKGFRPGEVFRNLWFTSGQMGAAQIFGIALNAGLSLLPQGSYAVFKYVQQLESKVGGLLLRPVSTVFFTHFSEAMSRGAAQVRSLARSALAKTLLLSVGAIAALSVCALPLLQGLWGSGRFPPHQLGTAATLLVLIMGLLIPQAANAVLRKLLVSAGLMGWLYAGMAAIQLAAAPLVWWLPSRWGLPGVVVVLALAQSLQIVFTWWLMRQRQPALLFAPDWRHLRLCLMAATLAAGLTFWAGELSGLAGMAGSRVQHLGVALLLGGAAAGLMGTFGVLLRIPEVLQGWGLIHCCWTGGLAIGRKASSKQP